MPDRVPSTWRFFALPARSRALHDIPAPDRLPPPLGEDPDTGTGLPEGWQQLPARGAKLAAAGALLGTLGAGLVALRQGRLWQSQTQVPLSRVQHLDLRRGPLERAAGLATLVVHTAGTRLSAVSVSGLDQRDAERLRERLARQLDRDDDAL